MFEKWLYPPDMREENRTLDVCCLLAIAAVCVVFAAALTGAP